MTEERPQDGANPSPPLRPEDLLALELKRLEVRRLELEVERERERAARRPSSRASAAPRSSAERAPAVATGVALLLVGVATVVALRGGGSGVVHVVTNDQRQLTVSLRLRHLVGTDGPTAERLLLLDAPAGRPLAYARQGASCEVVESVLVLGSRFHRVRVRGVELGALPADAVALAVAFGPLRAEAELLKRGRVPREADVEGWTIAVAE